MPASAASVRCWNPKNGDPAENLASGLRVANAIGATAMRCFVGNEKDRRSAGGIEGRMEKTIEVLRSARSQALDSGVKIGLESHAGDIQAREVRTIIEEAGKDFDGACLDTGNPMWVVEDPMVTLEVPAPYVVTTSRPRLGGVRRSTGRGGAMGGAGRRDSISRRSWPARSDHGPSAACAAVSRAGFLEGVSEGKRRGVRAFRCAGTTRPPVQRVHGGRGWRESSRRRNTRRHCVSSSGSIWSGVWSMPRRCWGLA
jgi:hypothetical protein